VHTMGVSAEPEISEHTIDGSDCFLILATDGIWDVIESAQAVQLVAQVFVRECVFLRSDNWSHTRPYFHYFQPIFPCMILKQYALISLSPPPSCTLCSVQSQHLARATASNPSAPWDVQDAATVLATTARRRWEQLSPMVDDITAIVVDLRPHVMGNNKP